MSRDSKSRTARRGPPPLRAATRDANAAAAEPTDEQRSGTSDAATNGPSLLVLCACSFFFCLVALSIVLRLYRADLRLPLNYVGDAMVFLTKAKGIVEGQWIWRNDRLGAPFGADFLDFPLNITLDSAVMKALSLFTNNPGLILNVFWLGALCATAAIATYCLRRLKSAPWVAVSLGVIYALQPYGFFRGISHLHCIYYVVPLIAAGSIELATLRLPESSRGNAFLAAVRWVPPYLWLGCVIAGFAYAYTAFFSCFALACATALGFSVRRDNRILVIGGTLVLVICAGAVLDLSPSLIHWVRHGRNFSMDFKYPAEADIYGLKVRFLVTPVPNHPLAPARQIEERLRAAKFPLDNENESARLGTVGSVGFVILMGWLLTGTIRGNVTPSRAGVCIGASAALCVMCILWATVGGLGGIFNTFVIADIRCYNRIAPFISFYSVVPVALLLTAVRRRWATRRYASGVFGLLLFGASVAAPFDQAVLTGFIPHEVREQTFAHDREFVSAIETVLPPGSAVFELPYMGYPVEYLTERLFNNDRGRPYIHSTKYRWSWAAVSGTTSAEWNRQAAAQPTAEMLHNLYHAGFAGVWVDLFGYNGQNAPEAALTQFLGAPRRSPNGRFLFYDMRAYNDQIATAEKNTAATLAEHPVWTTFERGFYDEDGAGPNRWHWARTRGRIKLINPLNTSRAVTVSMTVQTGYDEPTRIRIETPESSERLVVERRSDYSRRLTLGPYGQAFLSFSCDCRAVQSADPRDLRFSVSNFRIVE
jgi:phosphoglycerol transferase